MIAGSWVMSAWVASKYGSEKSMTSARASVIVMPAAATSQTPEFSACPDWMPSKPVISTAFSSPLALAISSMRDMSNPTTSLPSLNSNGS